MHDVVMAYGREQQRDGDPLEYMTSDHPSPYLFESQVAMLGRMGDGWTPRRRFFARLFASLALLPLLLGVIQGVIQMVRWIIAS